jgi:hypothetical protein
MMHWQIRGGSEGSGKGFFADVVEPLASNAS